MNSDNFLDTKLDLELDKVLCREGGPSTPAVFQSFPALTQNTDRSLFLDPAPPTSVGGRGQGASLGAGGEKKVTRKKAGVDGGKYVRKGEVGTFGRSDFGIIKLLIEQRYLDLKQVAEIFFKGDRANAYRRLMQLSRSQYLRRDDIKTLTKPITLYRATERARRVYELAFGPTSALPKTIVPSHIPHNLLVTDVRMRFRELWQAPWIPETVLKPINMGLTPDGVIHFKGTNHKVAIEVENTIKSEARYGEIFRAYKKSEYFLAIYVCTFETIFESLKSQMKRASYQAPLGVFYWEELKNSRPKLWTPVGDASVLERHEL